MLTFLVEAGATIAVRSRVGTRQHETIEPM